MVNHYLTPGAIIDSNNTWNGDIQTFSNGLTIGLAASAPAPDGDGVHIWAGSADDGGTVTAQADVDFVIEAAGVTGLSILTPANSIANIHFASPTSNIDGRIQYFHSGASPADNMRFVVNSVVQLDWSDGAFAFQSGATTISTAVGALTLAPVGGTSGSLLFTGVLAVTGSRVTQSYHTNITSTNALTVDSWSQSKENIVQYGESALDILQGVEVISFSHLLNRDPSGRIKLGIRAESIQEPLALVNMDYGHDLGAGPALDTMGLMALAVKAIQELRAEVRELKEA